ncbi:hypothetical protein GEV33_003504 [Tenebrio molitor]|uniref:Uncharacterized protein n=1 Tax=Tenebrio molitor TaxID=7067 RepID=A0A8J6HRF1_TENMO|nr:hypothetical protein GEV33_003504 [Tenebrio molitor]
MMNKTKSTPNCTYGDGGWNKKTDGFLFFNGDDLHFVSADRLQLDGWDSTEGTKDETETNGVEGDPRSEFSQSWARSVFVAIITAPGGPLSISVPPERRNWRKWKSTPGRCKAMRAIFKCADNTRASPGALLTSGGVSPRRFRPEPTPGSPPHLSVPALPKVPEAESAITERSHVGPPAGPRKRLFIHKLRAHGGRSSAPDPTQALFTPTDAQVRQA